MNSVWLSKHGIERAREVSSLVSLDEICQIVNQNRYPVGETWVKVKNVGEYISLGRASSNGNEVIGNTVWAVVKRSHGRSPALVTVLLAGNKKRNPRKHYIE